MNPEGTKQETLSQAEQVRQRINTGFKHVELLMRSSTYSSPDNPLRMPVSLGTDNAMARLIIAEQSLNGGNTQSATAITEAAEAEIKAVATSITETTLRNRTATTVRR